MKRAKQEGDIISVQKHSRDFSIIDNSTLRDPSLSLKATGLLTLLISYPSDWKINLNHLCNSKPDGRDSILSGLAELSEAGYLIYLRWRGSDGSWASRYIVFETLDLKEKYLEQMSEEDLAKITTPSNPNKTRSRKKSKDEPESTTENPQWLNGNITTDSPQRECRNGKAGVNKNIYTNTENKNVLPINTPLTPQGEPERGGDEITAVEVEIVEEIPATTLAPSTPTTQNTSSCQKQNSSPETNIPPADENHSQILPSDPMAERMQTQRDIVATGAMKGASHPDPEFLEYYRGILSKCTHYKGRDCNLNHAKAALKKLWNEEPLRILAEVENWQKSKAEATTRNRDIRGMSDDDRLALLEKFKQSKGA